MRTKLTRTYSVLVMRHGHRFDFYPPVVYSSNARIRSFTHDFFVRWFGRQPDRRRKNWHKDGFMAECWDRRGNCVQVEQHNWGDPRHTDGTWNKVTALTPAPPLLLPAPGTWEAAS